MRYLRTLSSVILYAVSGSKRGDRMCGESVAHCRHRFPASGSAPQHEASARERGSD